MKNKVVFFSRNEFHLKKHFVILDLSGGHRLVADIVCCHQPLESDYPKGIIVSEQASLSCHPELEE